MDQLVAEDLLDSTLVLVISEMTRTPKQLPGRTGGKGHWNSTAAMLIGGAVRGGVTYGGTDDLLEAVKVDLATGMPTGTDTGELLRYDNLLAGVLEYMDIDPTEWYPATEPFRGFLG